ncbi:uncharacterized protein EDB91DRAFT_1083356 [Suillus paluster]|uniref:uncharacterized protein n=1 Tax=Suillus paluster TaxID=48578 RepID=UPI001B876330|nr:uncharacterized protein EDB91DRAFT_1083356 [Suillus paluster]KAG1736388.1 hypothetical protein EDB91DRAFT_1083356 [Suillus paluster]
MPTPAILLTMLIALILNVFGHVTRPWCNAVLGLLNLLLETTLGKTNYLDVRYLHKMFVHVSARNHKKKIPIPGTLHLYEDEGRKSWAPVRPYVVQDFNAFLASLLGRPGIEEAMDRGTMINEKYHLWDIKDGTVMQDILGPDRKPFMDGLKRRDLRLAWSLSTDWFNPHRNKTSGKKKSVGLIAMGLLNLPPRHLSILKRDFQGPTANQMCGLCWQNKSDIANFNYDTWEQRTCEEHRAAAEEWKNAETKSERNKVFARHGVRWSELLRLPYWDPVRFIVIDGMHNLFLGVVQHHFRNFIAIDKQASKAIRKPEIRAFDPKDLDKGRAVLESKPTTSAMTRLRLPAKPTHNVPRNDKDQMEVDTEAFVMEELVKEYAADVEEQNDQKGVFTEALTDEEINTIQAELSGIKRPSWHRGPPKNLGDAEHGKLKAEQWRSAIEFDLPVTLVKLWGAEYGGGEMERTMLETFCIAASVKAMLQEPGAPNIINKAADILQQCCAPFTEGIFCTDTGILCTAMESIPYVSHDDANIIKAPMSDVLRHTWDKTGMTHLYGSDRITEYKRLNIGGLQYCSCNYSALDSCMFFKTSEKWVPGVIEHMFFVGQDHDRVYYITIRGYLPVPAGYKDPFLAYSDFGAQIWSSAYNSQLDIIPVCTRGFCHAVSMQWGTSELVLKPMNRDFGT